MNQSHRELIQRRARYCAPGQTLGRAMILRSTAAGVPEAERRFRKVAGYRALPKLVAALHAHDNAMVREQPLENGKRAA